MEDEYELQNCQFKEGLRLSSVVFSLFSAWLISFPYEGQVLYSLTNRYRIDPRIMVLTAMASLIVGLFCCGFFIHTIKAAKGLMLFSTAFCLVGSGLFFFPPSVLWTLFLPALSFAGGIWMAAWGFYFKNFSPPNERYKTAADVLAYSALLMISINMAAIHFSAYLGLGLALILLAGALLFTLRLPVYEQNKENLALTDSTALPSGRLIKPLAFLSLFIIIITIDSGLMFGVVNPAFEQVEWLASWYWAVPYIAAIWIVKGMPRTVNRTYVLYAAIAMIGLSFIAFMVLEHSVAGYLVVNTLLLGACGIFDLFWWSILGEMLDLGKNPAKILGFGLAANVAGVLAGELIAAASASSGISASVMSLMALTMVCFTFALFPLLHKYLLRCLKSHVFLTGLPATPSVPSVPSVAAMSSMSSMPPASPVPSLLPAVKEMAAAAPIRIEGLTERESQVARLILKGYSYKLIAAELNLKESTVKTHVRNIYSKLNINHKDELVKRFAK